jgi:hypothetical protein
MPNAKTLIRYAKYVGAANGGGYLYQYGEHLYLYKNGKVIPHEEALRQKMA